MKPKLFKSCKNEGCEITTDFINHKLLKVLDFTNMVIRHNIEGQSHDYLLEITDPVFKHAFTFGISTEFGSQITLWAPDEANWTLAQLSVENLPPTMDTAKHIADTVKRAKEILSEQGEQAMALRYAISKLPKKIRELKGVTYQDNSAALCFNHNQEKWNVVTNGKKVRLLRDSKEVATIPLADPEAHIKVKEVVGRKMNVKNPKEFKKLIWAAIRGTTPHQLWENRRLTLEDFLKDAR